MNKKGYVFLKREREREREREKKQEKDEEFFLRPHEHLTGAAYNFVIQKKKKIAAEYWWEF